MNWLDKYSDGVSKAQKGKKVKPIYVDSPNDPRYRAYQDSLSLYNESSSNFNKNIKTLPKNKFYNYTDKLDAQLDAKNKKILPIKSVVFTNQNDNYTVNTPIYKKPNQPVEVQNKPILQPKVEALNLQPVVQTPINFPVQQIDDTPKFIEPKAFNISSQRTNMQGNNSYYDYTQEGATYEEVMKAQEAANAYNKYIQEKYGNEEALKNPKAVERLKQLKQTVNVTPVYRNGGEFLGTTDEGFDYNGAWGGQFQMGGNVYPVNYIPKAQEGQTISVDEGDGKKRKILTDSKEYSDLFNEKRIGVKNDDGSISVNPLDEVVITPYDKQYPFYQELSDEEKKYFNSDSPIGRQIRSRAQDNVGFNAEKATDFAMGWLRDLPLAGMQAPQSALVEAVEAIRGNDYNFLNVIEPDKQRKPSDVWGIESDYYGVNPLNTMMPPINYKTIANTTMDFVTDPLLIEGIARQPLQKGIKNIISSDIDRQLLNIETIGKKQGLSAHEIAKNQMDQIGITSNQRKAYTPLVSETLEKYVTPYGYVGPSGKNKITDIIDNIKQGGWKNNLTNQGKLYHPEREDAFRLYLGLPQKNKTFNVSDTAPVLHNSYPKGTFNNMDIYNANTEDIIESVTPNIPKSFRYNDLVTNRYLDILNKNAVVSRDNTLMGGYNKVLTEDGLQYNDIWDLNVPISFKSLVPNKISESPALKNIFYKTNVQGVESPRSIKVPVEKFVGKPFMTHGNLPLTKTQYIEKLKTSAIETKNRYMTEDALEAFGNEYNSKFINASDNFLEKLNKYKQGGVIKDDLGQWAHPGEITEINSNDITMQGVPYPVLGISDTGDTKLMQPGKDYKFKGKKVTEYPLAKDGKELVKLNQLTNFTNYNTKQPGGWLDQY